MESGKLKHSAKEGHDEGKRASRRPYTPPAMVEFGDVRDVTLGASPGIGDSGTNPLLFKPA